MTPDEFADNVQQSLSRRKRELSRLRLSLVTRPSGMSELEWMTRAACVVTYAHWEGFVKDASKAYVRYLNSKQLQVSSLHCNLQAACLVSHFTRGGASSKVSFLGALVEQMDQHRAGVFAVRPEKVVETESNLSSVVFKEMVDRLGLDYLDFYQTRTPFVDGKLVLTKNQVAHGELVPFEREAVYERIDGVVLLINKYSSQLLDAVRDMKFLKRTT